MQTDFDIIIIGAGSGGLTAAISLAGAGKKVALVEAGRIGGDCTNVGCVPSKAFIDIAAHPLTPSLGRRGDFESISVKEVLKQVRERRQHFRDEETTEWLESIGIHFFAGRGSFIDKNTVGMNLCVHPDEKHVNPDEKHVNPDGESNAGQTHRSAPTQITAQKIIISTGSHPKIYPIKGLEAQDILTNENVFELNEEITDLVVVGGGYIGCELAESFANLGVKVTIIQRNTRLIPREEEEVSELIEKIFRQKGITILRDTVIQKAEKSEIIVENISTKKTKKITFSKVLVALGREANTQNLRLENAGITFSKKGIKVNGLNRTSAKNIFAIGDCVEGNPQFTHWANHEARGLVRNILVPFFKKSVRSSALPMTLYTNIEVARVGKTHAELLEYYTSTDITTKIMYFSSNDRSKITDDEAGFIKIHFKRLSGKILGATIIGTKAGEILPVLTMAMNNNISAYKLSSQIFAYPTKSELIKKVADQFVIGTLSNIKGEIKYFFKSNILQLITGVLWLTIIISYILAKSHYGFTNIELAKTMFQFVQSNAVWGPVIYIILYAFRPIVLFPATLMTFMSGALFGPIGGFIFTMIGENMSANFAYFLGRVFGKKLLKPESTGIIGELRNKLSGDSFLPILMTRLLFFPFDAVNYAAGILKAKWKGFFFGTLIGIIPGALVVILAGASVENAAEFDLSAISFNTNMLFISAGIFIGSLVLAKFLKKREVKLL